MLLFHNFQEKILFLANYFVSKFTNGLFFKRKLKREFKNILIVKWDEIGDMVMAMHLFEPLKQKYKRSKLTVLCKPICASLLKNHPFIDEFIHSSEDWTEKYDLVIELRGTRKTLFKSLKYKPRLRLDRGSVRIKNKTRFGFLTDKETNDLILKPLLGEISVQKPKIYTDTEDKQAVGSFIELNRVGEFAVFHATSNKVLKEWPLDRFAILADYVFKDYGLQAVFIGIESERGRIEKVMQMMKTPSINAAGVFSLTELYELFGKAKLFVGNDSGPMHIANAAGTPLVGLFGPGPADVFYPEGENCRIIHHVLDCNPCNQIHCVRPNDTCMQKIKVAEVQAMIREVMG
jgi:ADP-heptose:LPS heptosyltransferase